MYKTKIKDKYAEKIKTFFWGNTTEEYDAIMTLGNMTLLYCKDTGLMADVYNNKIETFQLIDPDNMRIEVEAKNDNYAQRFNLNSTYVVTGYTSLGDDKPTALEIKDLSTGMKYKMLPSRLKVVKVEQHEE